MLLHVSGVNNNIGFDEAGLVVLERLPLDLIGVGGSIRPQ